MARLILPSPERLDYATKIVTLTILTIVAIYTLFLLLQDPKNLLRILHKKVGS